MEAYPMAAKAKVNLVKKYVKDLMDTVRSSEYSSDNKIIIFAHHLILLDAVENSVVRSSTKARKINYIRIDGSTPSKERFRLVEDFQTKKKTRVAILSMKAAGVGLNLTRASTVIFTELTWTPGIISQCEDRAHRLGQKNSVNVIFLVAKNSVDDILWPMINSKVSTLGKMLDAKKDRFKARVVKQKRENKKIGNETSQENDSDEELSQQSYPRNDLRSMFFSPSSNVKKTSSLWTCSVCTYKGFGENVTHSLYFIFAEEKF